MWFITFVWKNLFRRPTRSLLTLFAISIAICAFVALVGVANGFQRSFTELYESAGIDLIVVKGAEAQRLNSEMPIQIADEIQLIPGVKHVYPGSTNPFNIDGQTVVFNGLIPETEIFDQFKIIEGRTLKKDDKNKILLGQVLASNLGKNVGDKIYPYGKDDGLALTVVGIFQSNNVYANGFLVLRLKDLDALQQREGWITGASIVLESGTSDENVTKIQKAIAEVGQTNTFLLELPGVKDRLKLSKKYNQQLKSLLEKRQNTIQKVRKSKLSLDEQLEEWRQITKSTDEKIAQTLGQTRVEQLAEFQLRGVKAMAVGEHVETVAEIQMAKGMAWVTSAIALLIGTFGVMNTMIMSVYERTREIGMFRAVGWRGKRVVYMILFESVVLSLIGAVIGIILAIGLVKLLTVLPQSSGFVAGTISPWLILGGFGIAVCLGLVGGSLPAIRAARLLPTEALRYE